jgi:UMF1 family MFS transporter
MFYINGLVVLFAFGGVYAVGTFNFSETDVLIFGILINIIAGIGAWLLAPLDDYFGSKALIILSLISLVLLSIGILLITSATMFWILGLFLGLFIGPVQSASRAFIAKTAPQSLMTQMFGILALSGKATSFTGPLLVGGITYLTESQRLGMSVVLGFFLLGLIGMIFVPVEKRIEKA